MQALNNNATISRSIYPITQNILQADIGNHSLILLQTTEYYKRELEMNTRLSSNSGDSMTPRLLLNSTKPKDYARNAREKEVCVCVCSILYPPPSIYSREPPAATPQTDVVSQQGSATCLS